MEISKFFMGVFLLATNYTNNKNGQPKKKNDCAQDTPAQCVHTAWFIRTSTTQLVLAKDGTWRKSPTQPEWPEEKRAREGALRAPCGSMVAIGMVRHQINPFRATFFFVRYVGEQ